MLISSIMPYTILVILTTVWSTVSSESKCLQPMSQTFVRWSGLSPEQATPVFVYSASGEEESLTGACLAQCRELEDCTAVIIAYTKGSCQGISSLQTQHFRPDNDIIYFKKVCLKLPDNCSKRWWTLESTPGYYLNSENTNNKILLNTTLQMCYDAVFSSNEKLYRSAQWIDPNSPLDTFTLSDAAVGSCILSSENKFTEPESYRVSNFYTYYIENQCGHDYPKKIDRCSYEEYYNQTIKHVDLAVHNYTKNECKIACEAETRFVCRGFTWTVAPSRGLCDLHSEDLVTAGSWLLRKVSGATYYRRVVCLNISVECDGSHLVVTYKPRVVFRGRVYVPGRGEHCSSRALSPTAPVRLALPLYGDCDVNFAYAITKGPNGNVNRTMAYVLLMIQNNPIIQTAGDRWVRVGCSPGAGAKGYTKVDATVAVQDSGRPSLASEPSLAANGNLGASAVFGSDTASLTMYVVRAHGDTGATAVSLGEPLELRIETTDEAEIEAYHLVASSRLGDSSVLLLDSRGCPTGQVDFPSFTRSYLGNTQRLSALFKAFRFPTSHVVRFAIMVRFCEGKCSSINCGSIAEQIRSARQVNKTYEVSNAKVVATPNQDIAWSPQVVAQGGRTDCTGSRGRVPLELEMVVGSRDILSADTLVRADHHSALRKYSDENWASLENSWNLCNRPINVETMWRLNSNSPQGEMFFTEDTGAKENTMICVHELLLVALVLIWLAVQVILLLGCCVLVKRYRNLAEMSMQKDYQSFDNVGFDTGSTHRRVHWPDQNIDIIHTT